MSCFSAIEKFFLSRCYPEGGPSGPTPISKPVANKEQDPPAQAAIPNSYFVPESRRPKTNIEEEDFFKDIEPTYTAPKTVSTKAEVLVSSKQFEMEDSAPGDWGTEEISFD